MPPEACIISGRYRIGNMVLSRVIGTCYTIDMFHVSNKLEDELLATRNPDLAWGALVASGISNDKALTLYLDKIKTLCQLFQKSSTAKNDLQEARALFNWLWSTKPNRYESQGYFRLTNVIDNQLDPSVERIGNCLGLTLLFNILAQKIVLKVKAVHIEETGNGPHVLSMLIIGRGKIDVENTLPNGFDFKEYLQNPHREMWNNRELIADIYHSSGNELFEHNELEEAIAYYTKAVTLNHRYTKAYFNRGIALATLGQDEVAITEFNKHSNSYEY